MPKLTVAIRKPLRTRLLAKDTPTNVVIKIDEKYYRNTENDGLRARWTVGNIQLRLIGILLIAPNGKYSFEGKLSAGANDFYNGGVSNSDRNPVDNGLTGLLSMLRDAGATEYVVEIIGDIPISLTGSRDDAI
jgi:hypothetical protein